jgi:ice-binding like protein/Big-like domain-containing protein
MRTLKVSKIWIPAFLLAVVMAGCSDSDKAGTGNPGDPLSPPTVTAVTPPDGTAVVCPNTPIITATFSKAMNPLTITTATFIVADSTGASVPGTPSLDSAGLVATFTPMNSLAVKTTFTATITTGAHDTFGNSLATNHSWMFTTSPFNPCPPPVAAVPLGAACGYGVLGHTTVTNTGLTHVAGVPPATADLGVSPGSAVTGFAIAPANTFVGPGTNSAGPGLVSGTIHLNDPPPPSTTSAMAAQAALTVAYNDLAGRTAPAPTILTGAAPDIGGQRLAPGIYKSNTSLAITGTVTLDGGGDPNAVWIFQIASTLITAGNSNVVLAGNASAHNVFWQVGSSATLGTGSTLNGSILALTSVMLTTGATLNGRALASTGAVTMDTNTVVVPACP